MTETTVGREPVQIVEIKQPFCSLSFGVSPCTARGTGPVKCYNTRSTCQDGANYAATTLSLFFSRGRVGEQTVSGATYIIPSLVSVSTSPTRLNVGGSRTDASGLGNRALCTLTFNDHTHTDRVVDKYVDERGFDPLTRGTFWTKWKARNRYRQNIQIIVYDGYAGQTLAQMSKKVFFLDNIQGPDDSGQVTIQGKDVLARLEERKAQVPLASPGVLYTSITNSQTSFVVAGALVADYTATGTLRIDSEIMTYTGRATHANGVEFTGVTRGTDRSTAATHSVDASVQQCYRVTNKRIDDTLKELLNVYGGVPLTYLDTVGWKAEVDTYLSLWQLNALITVPTAVHDLVSSIQEQTLVNCWWDEKNLLVKMRSIRGVDALPPLITEENNIIAGSFVMREKPEERVSQVWIYYDQRDKTRGKEETANYASLITVANLPEELLYGEPSVRKIFGNFLSAGALASTTASKIITRYIHSPSEIEFRMDAKDRDKWVGDVVRIRHSADRDEFGDYRIRQWLIVAADEVEPGETVHYIAEDITLYGKIYYIMAAGSANYPGAGLAPEKSGYIGNSAGLLSDGASAARIS